MSQSVTQMPAKKKRTRSPSVAKPAFVVVQMLDENGDPEPFDKKRIRIVTVERSAEKVLEMTEDGSHAHAFYLRVVVPIAKNTPQRSREAA